MSDSKPVLDGNLSVAGTVNIVYSNSQPPEPKSFKEATAALACINPNSNQGKALDILYQEINRLRDAQILITTSWVPPGIVDDMVKQSKIETIHQVFKLIRDKVNDQHLTELGLIQLYRELIIAYGGRGSL